MTLSLCYRNRSYAPTFRRTIDDDFATAFWIKFLRAPGSLLRWPIVWWTLSCIAGRKWKHEKWTLLTWISCNEQLICWLKKKFLFSFCYLSTALAPTFCCMPFQCDKIRWKRLRRLIFCFCFVRSEYTRSLTWNAFESGDKRILMFNISVSYERGIGKRFSMFYRFLF